MIVLMIILVVSSSLASGAGTVFANSADEDPLLKLGETPGT